MNDIEIGFKNLSHEQARALINYHQELIERTRAAATVINRSADIERTASALANAGIAVADAAHHVAAHANPTPPPPPAPVAAPVAAPSPAVSVPGGAPSTGNSTAPVDARGVPWDERYHCDRGGSTGGLNANGAWKKRKGHDPEAHKAYEAQFVGNDRAPAAASGNAPSITASPNGGAPASTATAPTVGGAPARAAENNPASYPPAPPPPPPPAPIGAPTFEEFSALWVRLCAAQRVTAELEAWIKNTYGGHPTLSDVFKHNALARMQVYEVLRGYDVQQAA